MTAHIDESEVSGETKIAVDRVGTDGFFALSVNICPEVAGLSIVRNDAWIGQRRQSGFVVVNHRPKDAGGIWQFAVHFPRMTNRITPGIFAFGSNDDRLATTCDGGSNRYQLRRQSWPDTERRRFGQLVINVGGVPIDQHFQFKRVFEKRLHSPARRTCRGITDRQRDRFAFAQISLHDLDVNRASPRTAIVFDVVSKLKSGTVGGDRCGVMRSG